MPQPSKRHTALARPLKTHSALAVLLSSLNSLMQIESVVCIIGFDLTDFSGSFVCRIAFLDVLRPLWAVQSACGRAVRASVARIISSLHFAHAPGRSPHSFGNAGRFSQSQSHTCSLPRWYPQRLPSAPLACQADL